MKKFITILFILLASITFAANEIIVKNQTTGLTDLYVILETNDAGTIKFWDGDSWEATPASWNTCDIALTEDAFMKGSYYASVPGITSDMIITINLYQGSTPAVTDTFISAKSYYWNGTYLLDPSASLNDVDVGSFSTDISDTLTLGSISVNNTSGSAVTLYGTQFGMYLNGGVSGIRSEGVSYGIDAVGVTDDWHGQWASDSFDLTDLASIADDWLNNGRLDIILDAILEDTGTSLPVDITLTTPTGTFGQ